MNAVAEKKNFNVGLNLLRILLTFFVVLDHFWWKAGPEMNSGFCKGLWQLRTLSVPAFMVMTFFFTANRFRSCDVPWLRKRFVRLLEPFVFWAVVYWIVSAAVSVFDGGYAVKFTDLLWQLALGSSQKLCMQFWFHGDLIILTALFFLAFKVGRHAKAYFHLAFGAIALGFTLQYTPLNDAMVGWMPFEAKYTLGRIAMMLPYAGTGFLLAALKDRLDSVSAGARLTVALFGLWLLWLVLYHDVCPRPPSEVGYAGLDRHLMAWGSLALFYYIPFDKMPAVFSKAVMGVSKYCMGVYCIHLMLGYLISDFAFGFPRIEEPGFGELRLLTVFQSFIVWVLSFVCCWLIARIPFGFCKRIVE